MDTGLAYVVSAAIAAVASIYAARMAHRAKKNTEPVSNGFAARMDRKLDQIIREQGELRGDFNTYREEHERRHERDDRATSRRRH